MGIMDIKKVIIPLLIAGFVLSSLSPSIYELSRKDMLQTDRQFELVHNFPTDYNFYLSRIREGLEGRITVTVKYTSEPHAGSLIHEMYLFMGRAGRFARVPYHRAGDVYHVARIVLAITLLGLIAAFSMKSFAGIGRASAYMTGLTAFVLAVTASSWPKLVEVGGVWRFGGYMAWWSVMDSLQRITFIPHLLAGQALIVFLILAVTSVSVVTNAALIMMLGLSALVLGMIFPPGLLFVYTVMAVYFLLSGRNRRRLFVPYVIIGMVSAASLFYLMLMTGIYPWKRLAEVDMIRPLPFDYAEYFRAMGPTLPLGLIGLVVALMSFETLMFPAVSWVIAWAALLGIFAFVPQQSPLRFSEMIPHVPLGALGMYALFRLYRIRPFRIVAMLVPCILIGTGVFHMYSSYLWQRDFVDHKIRATLPLVPTGSYVMYPLKDFISAMQFIGEQTKGMGVVLSETTAGNYIPVVSGNTVYAGHDNTVAFEVKKEKVREFFSGRMNADEAHRWIQSMGARYVFFGPQEREDGRVNDLSLSYPFLRQAYKNNRVTVYFSP